jgi:hypothetical protein
LGVAVHWRCQPPEIREAEQDAKAKESAWDRKIIVSPRLVDLHPIAGDSAMDARDTKTNEDVSSKKRYASFQSRQRFIL